MKLLVTLSIVQVLVLALHCVGCAQVQHPGKSKASQLSLVGEWTVVEQSATPVSIATLCQAIRPGSTITFGPATLAVYAATGKPCAVLSYKANGQFLSFSREDMVWLATYELTAERLTIRSPNLFTPATTTPAGPGSEIQVTLTRK